jgi:hypothetical protein
MSFQGATYINMVIGPYNLTYNALTMNTPKIYFIARSRTRVKAVMLPEPALLSLNFIFKDLI